MDSKYMKTIKYFKGLIGKLTLSTDQINQAEKRSNSLTNTSRGRVVRVPFTIDSPLFCLL